MNDKTLEGIQAQYEQIITATTRVYCERMLKVLYDKDTEIARLKVRVAALERVILDDRINFEFSVACVTCLHRKTCTYDCASKCNRDHHSNWQFDEAQFGGDEG